MTAVPVPTPVASVVPARVTLSKSPDLPLLTLWVLLVQCGKNSSFFTRRAGDWSLASYLAFRHHPYREPRRILDSWRLALQNIATCESECHTDAQCTRASNLLARFDEKVCILFHYL